MVKHVPSGEFAESENFFSKSELCSNLLGFFSESLKIPLTYFDTQGNQILPLYGSIDFCTRFANLDDGDKINRDCLKFHKELFAKAREKDSYRIMKCPVGLYCFAMPVSINNQIIGFIWGGHILAQTQKEDLFHKIKTFSGDGITLWELFQKIPVHSKKDIERYIGRLTENLRMCVRESFDKHQSNRQLRKLFFASRINEMVNTKLKLEDLLERSTKEIADALEVDGCLILLWDREKRSYGCFATNGVFPENEISDMKFRMGEGVTGIVASTGKPVIIKDALNDPRVVKKSLGIKSLLTVPLKVGEESIGVLHVATLKKIKEFTKRELELVEALSSEVALAVNNTRLYEEGLRKTDQLKRSKQELQMYFSQMGSALSSALDLHQLLRMIVELSMKFVSSDAGSLYLIEDRALSSQVTIGLDPETDRMSKFRIRESLLGWGDLSQGIFSPGVKKSAEFLSPGHSLKDEMKSYIGIPLSVKDDVIGLLNIYSKDIREFQPERVELLSAFAGQAAMAIDNALNFEKEQKRAQEATMLYEAARAIGQGFDISQVLTTTVQKLVEITKVDRCLLFLFDDKKKGFYTASSWGLSDEQREFFHYYEFPASHISPDIWNDLSRGKPRLFSSIPQDCPALERLLTLFPSNSCLLIPLIAMEKLIGLIYLDDSKVAHYFSDSQIRLVMTLSIQIATALHRARLIRKQEENTNQLKALLQVSSVLPSSLSLPKVFSIVVEKAAQLVRTPAVGLLMMDESENDFILQDWKGLDSPLKDSLLQKLIAAPAIEKKRYTTFYAEDDPTNEVGKALRECGAGGVLSIPLVAKRRLVGVLNCFSDEGHKFDFEEIRLLRSFANHAAIAVENARLYGVVKNKVRELATLFEVGKAITSTLEFERVMEEIARNIKRAMDADACSIMLLDEDRKELTIQTALGLMRSHFGQKVKLGEGIAGIAAKTGRPMILLDMQGRKSPYKFPNSIREEGLKTILSVPMETRGKIIGLINIYLKEIYYYRPSEINLLVALSNQAAIALENARLYEEQYSIARILQEIVMPQKEFIFPGIELGYHYISSLELSGDYFDLIPLSDTRFSMVIADVSGKGPPAAIYTARAKYILKSYATANYQPREILSMVNNLIVPETGDDKFISLFYMEVDLKRKLIKFSSAGHEPPIFYCRKTGELSQLEAEGLLIGVNYDVNFRQEEISFENGDLIVLYTDGITEARGFKGEIFGLGRLMEIVSRYADLDPQTLANRIYTTVQKYTRRKLNDDFSLLVVRL